MQFLSNRGGIGCGARSGRVALGVCILALAGQAASADMVEQQLNGPPGPGPFYWALADIGWYWTPTSDYNLEGIQTQLASGFSNINNNFTFETTLYTDRPDAGGVPISSFTWNGVDYLDGAWVGGSFPVPVPVSSATTYFVGISGWDSALGWAGQSSGAGINWVDSPVGDPVDNLGVGSSWGSVGLPDSFDTQFSPSTLGATDQPVIRFLSDVPNPATVSMLGIAACSGLIRRRR